jgi:hypothetical protein
MSRPIRRPDDPDLANLFDAATKTPKVQPQNATELRAHSIANIAELRRTPGSNDGNGGPRAVMLAGQLTVNDAGSGTFVWDSTSTLADNAQITASAFTVAQVASVSMGRWVRQAVPPIGAGVVTNAQLAQAPAFTIKGNPTGATATETDMNTATLLSIIGPMCVGVQVFTASGTYTPTAGTKTQVVEGWGCGGGGGSTTSVGGTSSAGGGGGSGGYWRRRYAIVSGSGTGTVTIGTAGTGGTAGGTGGTGGTTVFTDGTTICTAFGGQGGQGGNASTAGLAQGASSSVLSTGGAVNSRGNPGMHGITSTATTAAGGQGASTPVGAGGGGLFSQSGGLNGSNGSGGSGGCTLSGGGVSSGGTGGNGIVIITEFA